MSDKRVSSNLRSLRESHTLEQQLTLLAEVSQSFASSLNIEETLNNAITRFMEYLDAEAASIFLLENNASELVCRACAGPVEILGLRLPAMAGIIGKSVTSRSCQIVRDVSTHPDFAKSVDEESGFITRSILCTPLVAGEECLGALELINKRGGDGLFDDADRDLLRSLASSAALAIHNARMAKKLIEQERMQRELEVAREIQLSLLPASIGSALPVYGINIPVREVSGDFYDYFSRRDGQVYFCIGDVSGKGVNAALMMAKASGLLRHLARDIGDVGQLLSRVNNELCESSSQGMFVTLACGFVNVVQKTVTLANAGHVPPLLFRGDNRFDALPAEAPPLGVIPDVEFPVITAGIDGGSLYLYTDGVTESTDSESRPLDENGLRALIQDNAPVPASRRLGVVVQAIEQRQGTRHDDITMLLVELTA